MKKVIVLGASGQLGKTIRSITETDANNFVFISKNDLDITDKNKLVSFFESTAFDYCINCAAYTNVEGAESNVEDAFLINAEGAKNVAEVCEKYQVKLIHISTDYVFDGKSEMPYTTIDQPHPINQYGKSKLLGEQYIQDHLKEHYIIRTSWLYSLFGKNFLKTIINKIENDSVLNITTEEEGTPTSCVELAQFILYIIKTDNIPYGIYNFSANGSATWYEFAKEIVINLSPEKKDNILSTNTFKTVAKRPRYSVLNLKNTEKNYRELFTWQQSVAKIIEVYKNRYSSDL
ncbi:dTDP-4-dehydrorhamnose reductase [Winogradskyella bathintestinalis]|uniref:dTDP-4-dehydrorhamnose reductase n=1 Tax=Winogradskyella bathintestinalis TaxID=3035208 RepID=A0ABT7ZRE5_9FLAO|nr:dTDP-4-dehydrorhamnose reductase [Winogradskyella bathintestinalis]MDN3491583.1 dTDP-4-dehydrorhamnose reductase [Winogradskyella bathintestinalis]